MNFTHQDHLRTTKTARKGSTFDRQKGVSFQPALTEEAVGLIDWDYLHPAPRLDDVTYALRWFGPLRRDEFVLDWHHFPVVPNRRERVRAFVDAYGGLPRFEVSAAVMARMQATSDLMRSHAQAGQEPQRAWVADGALDRDATEIAWVRDHSPEFI